jgi:hypothetical protein
MKIYQKRKKAVNTIYLIVSPMFRPSPHQVTEGQNTFVEPSKTDVKRLVSFQPEKHDKYSTAMTSPVKIIGSRLVPAETVRLKSCVTKLLDVVMVETLEIPYHRVIFKLLCDVPFRHQFPRENC